MLMTSIPPDTLRNIMKFLHLRDLETFAPSCRTASELCRVKRQEVLVQSLYHIDWTPDTALDAELIVPAPLMSWVRPCWNLRTLELVGCRVRPDDLRQALMYVSGTLERLRLEMIKINYDTPNPSPLVTSATQIVDGLPSPQQQHPQPGGVIDMDMAWGAARLRGLAMVATRASISSPGAAAAAAGASGNDVEMRDSLFTTTTTTTTSNDIPLRPRYSRHPMEMVEEQDHSVVFVTMTALERLEISPPLEKFIVHAPKLHRVSSFRKMLEDVCTTCRSPRPDFKCSKCKFYAYCSQPCQSADWNRNRRGHRIVCCSDENYARDIVGVVERACSSSQLRVLDIAHFWQRDLLFKSALESGSDDEQQHQVPPARSSEVPLFCRPVVVNTLPHLTALRLLRCGLDDSVLSIIGSTMAQLVALDVSLNSKLTNEGLTSLHTCVNMQDLRLRQNYRFTDAGLRALSCLKQLTFLDACCGARRSVPHNAIMGLNNHADAIKFVWTASHMTILHLAQSCPHLRTLRVLRSSDAPLDVPALLKGRITIFQLNMKEFHELKDILGETWPSVD